MSGPYPPGPTSILQPSMQQGPPEPQYGSFGHQHFVAGSHYQEPAGKRQRTSIVIGGNNSHEQEPRYDPGPYTDARLYNTYPAQYQVPPTQTHRYSLEPYSATSSVAGNYSGHQHTNSSPASSPYVSPRTDVTGYSSTPSTYHPMHHSRGSSYPYPHHVDSYQENHVPQLAYPTPPKHHVKPLERRASDSRLRAAEDLALMSQAPVNQMAARFSGGGNSSERVVHAQSEARAPIVLPPPNPSVSRQPMSLPSQPGSALQVGSDSVPPGSAPQFRRDNVLPGTAPQLRSNDLFPRLEATLSPGIDRKPVSQPYQSHQFPVQPSFRGAAI